ncbi:hypothetical protein DPX39_100119700 [Trypanosoma brucei equiperdum]|uniref:Uncharacterized protein n=1 Tax=Trypanosoma brucei equiperdum TaxID=630700 RepID=A0A3L6KYU3_9TRYP|nr:hypothetical protein DPX39_100119700 [Trypanosoma brucei equiperdum]
MIGRLGWIEPFPFVGKTLLLRGGGGGGGGQQTWEAIRDLNKDTRNNLKRENMSVIIICRSGTPTLFMLFLFLCSFCFGGNKNANTRLSINVLFYQLVDVEYFLVFANFCYGCHYASTTEKERMLDIVLAEEGKYGSDERQPYYRCWAFSFSLEAWMRWLTWRVPTVEGKVRFDAS